MSDSALSSQQRRRPIAPLARLLPYIATYRGLVAGALLSLLLSACATLTLPVAVRRMIDNGFSQAGGELLGRYFVMLIIVAAVLAAASGLRYYFVITLGERVVADLRRDVVRHATTLSASFFDTARSGEIMSRLTADATQIKTTVGSTASTALRNLITTIGAIILMMITSPWLSLLVVGAIPIILIPLIGFGRSVRVRSRHAQDMLADASAYAGEQIAAMRTLQAFTNEEHASGRFALAVDRAFEAARSSIRARAVLTFFAILMIFSSVVAVLWSGSHDVIKGTMTPGTLGQFVLYAVLAAGALGALSEVWGDLAQAAGAAERMSEILDEQPAITAPANPVTLPKPLKGAIRFDNVSFSYPARPDYQSVKELSFEVAHGETVAIVGPSGAGKSTIFSLLMRFYDPEVGGISVDGIDLRSVDPIKLRQQMALVPQDVVIFADTVRENIGFGRADASEADIKQAAGNALAAGFIDQLANGYETQVGERGIMLSGGQRQRIGIARAILRDAPILLLDEATSALDAESETLVQKALEGLMEGRTTIVIAHRLATILKADRILVIDEGRLVEEGTHDSLVRLGGTYAKLAHLQFARGADAFQLAD